jgi:hypothetical protein
MSETSDDTQSSTSEESDEENQNIIYEESDEDTDGEYVNYSHNPVSDENNTRLRLSYARRLLRDGRREVYQETQTIPYERKTLEARN